MKNTKILYNMSQNLTEAQKRQARDNLGITGSLPTPPGSGMILSTDSSGEVTWMPKYKVKYPEYGIIHIDDSDNSMWVGAFYNNPVNGSLSGATFSSGKWVYNIPVPSPRNYAFGSCWLQVSPYVNARTNNAKVGLSFDLYLKDVGRHGLFLANAPGLRLEDSVSNYIAESRGRHMIYIEKFYDYDHIEVTIDQGELQGTEDMRLDYQFVFNAWMPGGY